MIIICNIWKVFDIDLNKGWNIMKWSLIRNFMMIYIKNNKKSKL